MRARLRSGDLVAVSANETLARRAQLQQAVFDLAQGRELLLRTMTGAKRRGAGGPADHGVIDVPQQFWLLPPGSQSVTAVDRSLGFSFQCER